VGQFARAGYGRKVVAVFAAIGRAGFLWGYKGIEPLIGPVRQHRFELLADLVGRKILRQINAGDFHRTAVSAGKNVHGPVMVDSAEHLVEIYPTVKEAPSHITHQCTQ